MERARKIKTKVVEKVTKYYSSIFFGLPSSFIAYRMIKELNKLNNEYLWYAIVGVTAMFSEQKLPKEQFEMISDRYKNDLSRFNSAVDREGENGYTA